MTSSEFIERVNSSIEREARAVLVRFGCADALAMLAGGKRLRALLVYSLSDAPGDRTVVAASAIELFHAHTLVQDDIIDQAATRRDQPTLSAKYGVDLAIMVAGALFASSCELARRSLDAAAQADFNRLYLQVAGAQSDEIAWRGKLRSEQLYREISHGKTGLLYQFCVRAASGTDETYQTIVANIAYAFQVVDDIDDCLMWLGDDGAHASKAAQYDHDLGNITLPAILALKKMGATTENFDSERSLRALNATDWRHGVATARQRVADLLAASRALLDALADSEQKQKFGMWAEPMMRQLEVETAKIDAIAL